MAKLLVGSEYWAPVLTALFMPMKLVIDLEQRAGNKRVIKKHQEKCAKERMVAAANYDRESRRREYTAKRELGKIKSEENKLATASRASCNGELPPYPADDDLFTDEPFLLALAESEQICKSWGPTWFKKRHRTEANARKVVADGMVKAVKLVEKVGIKTDKQLSGGKRDSHDRWPQAENSRLSRRVKVSLSNQVHRHPSHLCCVHRVRDMQRSASCLAIATRSTLAALC